MSDRIDELVDAVNKMTFTMADTWFDGSDVDASARFAAKDAVMETVTELATIARDAEARALKAEARAIEKEQKYREADERAWACESVGIPGLEARALEAEAMCEWLVKYAADCGECPRTRYDEDEDGCRECLDSIRRAAREAEAALQEHIAAFDPEHVALMRAVSREAILWLVDDLADPSLPPESLDIACAALITFEMERGLYAAHERVIRG